MLRPVSRLNFSAPGGVQRELHVGLVVLVDAGPGVLEVAPRDHRLAAHQVEDRLPGCVALALHDLHVVGHLALEALEQRLPGRRRVLDELERELRRAA